MKASLIQSILAWAKKANQACFAGTGQLGSSRLVVLGGFGRLGPQHSPARPVERLVDLLALLLQLARLAGQLAQHVGRLARQAGLSAGCLG